jgi:CBS domain-containing protein
MKTAADIMTPDPACCAPDTPLGAVAKLMVQHNCGQIPVVDAEGQLIGVVTDRDIVCRVLATGKNPLDHTVQDYRSQLSRCTGTPRSLT